MAWTFSLDDPVSDKDSVRISVGDVRVSDGPAPDRANLSDELIEYFLATAGGVVGAVALAFEHLAALWISRPIFGPGELSTYHVDMFNKYTKAAELWRTKAAAGDSDMDGDTAIGMVTMVRLDGYSDAATEYTREGLYP